MKWLQKLLLKCITGNTENLESELFKLITYCKVRMMSCRSHILLLSLHITLLLVLLSTCMCQACTLQYVIIQLNSLFVFDQIVNADGMAATECMLYLAV